MPTFDLCKAIPEDVLAKEGLDVSLKLPWHENELGMDRNGCVVGKGRGAGELVWGFFVTDRNVEYLKAVSGDLPFRETTIDGRVAGVLGPEKDGQCTLVTNLSGGGGVLIDGQFVQDPCKQVTDLANTLIPFLPR